ncbi:hypothetical protein [Lentibacillus sp. CBA3610]|uniref:hypothetical protein n=1 Tax=Lentibacillus sp. CBA3610 TaxID=2518176 RepID=UPI001595041E|nr:hypothetical protein [Lentibacillus sp. CBA3610]QKY70110.1 hypothetical protein Len3610_11375 [Lentibacillus sp. CBA3610]
MPKKEHQSSTNKQNKKKLDEFEEQKKFMDEPPDEELKEEMRGERDKFTSKGSSKSERKHKSNLKDRK